MDLLSSNHCSVAIGPGVEIRYFVTILSSLYPWSSYACMIYLPYFFNIFLGAEGNENRTTTIRWIMVLTGGRVLYLLHFCSNG